MHSPDPLSASEILEKMPTDKSIADIYHRMLDAGKHDTSIPRWGDAVVWSELNFTEALQLIWALAANGDKDIDNPEVWYGQFEFFPLDEVLVEVGPALFESCISTKKFKALSQKVKKAVPKK